MTAIEIRNRTQSAITQPASQTPTVFVVDGDSSVRESLELLIVRSGWEPITFGSAQEFLASPPARVPNCLILDVNLPDLGGLEVQKRVVAERTATPVIFVTRHCDVGVTVEAMKAGAVEFLTKPFVIAEVLEATAHALERSRCAIAHDAVIHALRTRYASLTRRQREVMTLVVSGLLNKQVGGQLGISEITVKVHRGEVMRKMKADSLPALVTMSTWLGAATPTIDTTRSLGAAW
jgi:FixJ family two-component response regulator